MTSSPVVQVFTRKKARRVQSRAHRVAVPFIPALHIALHFFAVADLISSAVLYLQLRRADKLRQARALASAGTLPQHPTDVQ